MNNRLPEQFGLYKDQYQQFFNSAGKYTGYDFAEPRHPNVPSPAVTFSHPLTWWNLDRPRRFKEIRRARDEYLSDILRLRDMRRKHRAQANAQRRKYKGLLTGATDRSRNFTIHADNQFAA